MIGISRHRLVVWIFAMLLAMVMPARASAQEAFGPPVPANIGSDATRNLDQSVSDLNPLAILGRVGEVVGQGRQADGTFGPSTGANGGSRGTGSSPSSVGLSTSINVLIVLTVLTLAPSIMLMCTCFVRILIVLGLLKQALGTQSLPPPQVIVGLAMFMTLLVMAPTIDRIRAEAIAPYRAGTIQDYDKLWAKTRQPMRDFMFDQIEATGNWSSVYMVLNYRGIDTSKPSELSTESVDMISLVPAFMLSELKAGFLIGFKVYLPFLVIDIVISSLLISMGMMMLPPVLISLPFKLLLFVLVDGWQLVVGSLMQSFVTHPVKPSEAVSVIGHAARGIGFG